MARSKEGRTFWAGGLLEVQGLSVTLGRDRVLDAVDLAVEPRTWTAVIGPNGSGASTLLRALAGVGRHDGRVLLDGRNVDQLDPRSRAAEIGFAPQAPILPESLAVREYVMLGRMPYRGLIGGPTEGDRDVVTGVLDRLDLLGVADRPLRALSGGHRQRVVLARAVAQGPRVLLLDEPVSALDVGHGQRVLELVDELRRDEGITVVTALHDLTLAGQYADRLVLLAGGRVAAAGPPAEVLTSDVVAEHYGASVQVITGPDGVRVVPVRPARTTAQA